MGRLSFVSRTAVSFLSVLQRVRREKLGFASCFGHCNKNMGDADLQAWEAFFTAASDPCFLIRVQADGQFLLSRVNDAWECATGIPRTTVLGERADAHLSLEIAEARRVAHDGIRQAASA